jgi:hypothetical protein
VDVGAETIRFVGVVVLSRRGVPTVGRCEDGYATPGGESIVPSAVPAHG